MEFKAELERSTAAPSWRRWTRSPTAPVLVLLVAALALALPFYRHRNLTTSSIPEKSIAVLPFENLSDNKENADFAAGIQDDVLTSLAQIHDLKVISRTSVMAYQKADGRNMREISQAAGRGECSRRERPPRGQPRARQRPADRRSQRPPPLGGALRPRRRRFDWPSGRAGHTDRGRSESDTRCQKKRPALLANPPLTQRPTCFT